MERGTSPNRLQNIVAIRGTAEWSAWFKALAVHLRLKQADAIEQALIELAKRSKFPQPPPDRLGR